MISIRLNKILSIWRNSSDTFVLQVKFDSIIHFIFASTEPLEYSIQLRRSICLSAFDSFRVALSSYCQKTASGQYPSKKSHPIFFLSWSLCFSPLAVRSFFVLHHPVGVFVSEYAILHHLYVCPLQLRYKIVRDRPTVAFLNVVFSFALIFLPLSNFWFNITLIAMTCHCPTFFFHFLQMKVFCLLYIVWIVVRKEK